MVFANLKGEETSVCYRVACGHLRTVSARFCGHGFSEILVCGHGFADTVFWERERMRTRSGRGGTGEGQDEGPGGQGDRREKGKEEAGEERERGRWEPGGRVRGGIKQ